jgi:hypothetical protein
MPAYSAWLYNQEQMAHFLHTFVAKEFETDILELSGMTEGSGREMQAGAYTRSHFSST